MEWDTFSIIELKKVLYAKHREMRDSHKTDRRNFSAIWNRYLGVYGAVVLGIRKKDVVNNASSHALLRNLIGIINDRNDLVAGALMIENPDRLGQFILIPRESAEKILVLGAV